MDTHHGYADDEQRPETGATDEAVALHGDQARAERHEQPDATELPAGTRIATGDDPEAESVGQGGPN